LTGKQHLSIGSQKHNGNAQETTLTGSTLGSSAGDVSLKAGRELKVLASDLVSTQDMSLTAGNVTIAAGIETAKQTSQDSSRSLAVGRVIGGMVVDTVQSIRNDVQAARKADDDRLKAVKVAQAALSAYNLGAMGSGAAANVSEGKPANSSGSLIKIGTEVASTRSKSSSEYASQTAKQATLISGDSLAIVATGNAGSRGDIHVIGSRLKADDSLLLAKRDLTLESAQNRKDWDNQNSTNRVSVGASFNIGQQNGFTIDLGAKTAKGMGTGHEVVQVNSTLDTGSLILKSGQDTTLAGAQVHAETLKAEIGGDLNIASRQDEASQNNRQTSGGFGGSICVPPICYGATVSGSANVAAGKTSSSYQAVTEQSGLFAGKGGYAIAVGNTTKLEGALIASEAAAGQNLLSTDRLIVSDLKNRSEIKSQAASLSASYSSGGQQQNGSAVKADSGIGGGLPLALKESEHSSTRSAVSAGSIVVRTPQGATDLTGLNRDTANANQRLDRPDEKAMQERMDLIQSTVELGKSALGTLATAKQEAAKEATEKAGKTQDPADIQA
ncbi:MAG: hemagglutinin repeat-containing protein, partial [Pseudomonas sp.]